MKTPLKMLLTAAVLLLGTAAQAQFYPPNPSNNEYPYPPAPPPPPVGTTTKSSCYSFKAFSWSCSPTLLVNSWEGPGATGFAWQAVDPTTWTVYEQGYYLYPAGSGIRDLNVGIIYAGMSGVQINVSYHKAGTGHFVDIWDWQAPVSCGGPGGVTLFSSNQLSCIPGYTRISMDSHKAYGTAIVWEDPGNGIDVVAAFNNSFGPTFTFSGTNGHTIPDVAFTHTGSGTSGMPEIHVVSLDPTGMSAEEYLVSWADLIPGGSFATMCPGFPCSPCMIPRTIEDIAGMPGPTNNLEIDAPDHCNINNWAYTFQVNNDIYARVMNWQPGAWPAPSFSGTAGTVCFTDGSYSGALYPPGLPPINSAINDIPVVAYDQNVTGGPGGYGLYVAWRTNYLDPMYNPASNAYIGIEINGDGTIRYPLTPNSFFGASMVPGNVSPSPTIAMSMANDVPAFLYAVFSESNSGAFWMQHRWVPWNVGQFKSTSSASTTMESREIRINPNPFKDDLRIEFPHDIEMDMVAIKITDMAGKEYGTFSNRICSANAFLTGVAKTLVPGNYIVSVDCKKANLSKTFRVVKVD